MMKYPQRFFVSVVFILLLLSPVVQSETHGQLFVRHLLESRADFNDKLTSKGKPLVDFSPANVAKSWLTAIIDIAEKKGVVFVILDCHDRSDKPNVLLIPLKQGDLDPAAGIDANSTPVGVSLIEKGEFERDFRDLIVSILAVRSIIDKHNNDVTNEEGEVSADFNEICLFEHYDAKLKFANFTKIHLSDWIKSLELNFATEEMDQIEDMDFESWKIKFGSKVDIEHVLCATGIQPKPVSSPRVGP